MAPQVEAYSTRLVVVSLVAALVCLATWGTVPWRWEFAATCALTAFFLQLWVRLKSAELERLIHVVVLVGAVQVLVARLYGLDSLGAGGVVHVCALAVLTVGSGYWAAERVRASGAARHAV